MKTWTAVAVKLALVAAVGLAQAPAVHAAAIKVLCSTALRPVMQELVPQFERATGHAVVIEYGASAAIQFQADAGAEFDAIFLNVRHLDALVQRGRVDPGTRTPIARSGMAVAVRAGAARPDIGTIESLTRTVLAAASIAYVKEGASGLYFIALAKRLGVLEKLRLTEADSGDAVADALAKGTAELGILPVSEILPAAGIDLLGEFPEEVQEYAVSVGGVRVAAAQAGAAKELLAFVTAPAAARVMREKGMEPQKPE